MIKCIIIYFAIFIFCEKLYSQDPDFTQFSSAPIAINPNYVGVFDGNVRITTNQRKQWLNSFDPITTTSVGLDFKLKFNSYSENLQNPLNFGVYLLSDRSLKSVYKSDCISSAISYHVTIDDDGYKSIGGAIFGSYTNKRIDLGLLSFDSQFTSNGFNLGLPNGESSSFNFKPFVSVGAGLIYLYNNPDDGSFFDFGISGYNINQPNQTFFKDSSSILPVRISAHISHQKYLDNNIYYSLKAIFKKQSNIQYLQGGFTLGKSFNLSQESSYIMGIGLWYKTSNLISPELLLGINNFHIGVSYDILLLNNINNDFQKANSFEISMQLNFPKFK